MWPRQDERAAGAASTPQSIPSREKPMLHYGGFQKAFQSPETGREGKPGDDLGQLSAQAPAQLDKAGANRRPMLFQGRSNSRMSRSSSEIRGGARCNEGRTYIP